MRGGDDERFRREYLCQWVEPNRGTGRTTAIALELLSSAIKAQGEWVRAFDHYPEQRGQVELRNVVQDMASAFRLEIEVRLTRVDRLRDRRSYLGKGPDSIVEVRSTRKRPK